jgi:DNA-binding NarL/FixJ family response regulator
MKESRDGRSGNDNGLYPVILADRRPIVSQGLQQILIDSPFCVSASAGTPRGLIDALMTENCRMVLSDLEIDGGSANDVIGICNDRAVPLLFFSHDMHPGILESARRSGGAGWIAKSASGPDIIATMLRVANGDKVWPRRLLRQMAAANLASEVRSDREFPLTARELEVLRLFANGNSNRRIADQLEIGFETVKDHVQRILEKLRVANRTEAAVLACRKGVA